MSPRDIPLQQFTSSSGDTAEVSTAQKPARAAEGARAETASVEAQLRLIQAAMKEERALRLSQAAQSDIQLADMRRALEFAAVERSGEPHSEGWFPAHVVLSLVVTAALVTLAGLLVFHADWVGGLLHPWTPDPRAAHEQAAVKEFAPAGSPSPDALLEQSEERYQLARLNGALDAVPAASVPTIMNSVNRWLRSLGGPPCSVSSASGEVSLVISGRGQAHPLRTALSRCADAVEHFTGDEGQP